MRWIVGDVHGMLRPLQALLDAVRGVDPSAQWFFLGDYANRGPDSRGVIDLLLTVPVARFLRGNHDDILDQVLNGQCYADNASKGDRLTAFRWFMQHGLDNTLASYGIDRAALLRLAEAPSLPQLLRVVEQVPESHRRFIRNLEPVIEHDDLFIAHGRWDPDEPQRNLAARLAADADLRHELLWGRFGERDVLRLKAWGRTGYFGHTPVDCYSQSRLDGQLLPVIGHQMVLLDTAAALRPDGRLTAYCADTRKFVQAERDGRLLGP